MKTTIVSQKTKKLCFKVEIISKWQKLEMFVWIQKLTNILILQTFYIYYVLQILQLLQIVGML